MTAKQYIRRVEPFEAIQWTGENLEAVEYFLGDRCFSFDKNKSTKSLSFSDRDGVRHLCAVGGYIVSIRPHSVLPKIDVHTKLFFERTYRELEDSQ